MEQLLAVTAIGPDRTGLVKDLSTAISSAGGSIMQSRMTTLGQEFAMLVLVSANWHAIKKVEESLGLAERTDDLVVVWLELVRPAKMTLGSGCIVERDVHQVSEVVMVPRRLRREL